MKFPSFLFFLPLFLSFVLLGFVVYVVGEPVSFPRAMVPESAAPVVTSVSARLKLEEIFSDNHGWVATLPAERVTTLVATGDYIPARSVNMQSVRRRDFRWPFLMTSEVLRNGDVTVVSMDTPLVSECPVTDSGMIFCGDLRHVEGLEFAGVDVVNLSNNHAGNYGQKGIDDTVKTLSDRDISVSGLGEAKVRNVSGLRFVFVGFNDVGGSGPLVVGSDKAVMERLLTDARTKADIVVASLHAGEEYTSMPTKKQRELAYFLIDHGADLVIGNHPHWVQPVEVYKGKVIAYSHGNFAFDQMWSEETKIGVVGRYTFYDSDIVDIEFLPVYIKDYGQPSFMATSSAEAVLHRMYEGSVTLSGL